MDMFPKEKKSLYKLAYGFPEIIYTTNSLRQQNFSLPSSIIYYITNYPTSAKGYLKLQKTCKYFFSKKKIVVTPETYYLTENEDILGIMDYNTGEVYTKAKLPSTEKFQYWPTTFFISIKSAQIFDKIYCLDARFVFIQYQDLTLKEFDYIASNKKLEGFHLFEGNLRNENGFPVPIYYVLSKLPNIFIFTYGNKCEVFNSKTFETLNSLNLKNNFTTLEFDIHALSEEIDPLIIWKFMCKIINTNGQVSFYFPEFMSEAYKSKFKKLLEDECENLKLANIEATVSFSLKDQ